MDPVAAAVEKVRGANPMAGILELKALAEAEPPNVDAVIELGRFSIHPANRTSESASSRPSISAMRAEPWFNSACSSWTEEPPGLSISNGL